MATSSYLNSKSAIHNKTRNHREHVNNNQSLSTQPNQPIHIWEDSQQNEFTWVIRGNLFDALANNNGQGRQTLQSPPFIQCGSQWILELNRNPKWHANDFED
eukprot:993592_1